ncbi:MAG: hypothetical protein PHG29_08875, partial [Prolixibacteraceae bacterium]|nr:hypothetical protein [Prolixibacteraceae bacterium]
NRLICGTDSTTRVGPPFQSYGTMFGKDEKDNPLPVGVGSFVKSLHKAGLKKADIEQIGYSNASKLLKLPS